MTIESVDPAELGALVTDLVAQHTGAQPEDRLTGLWATLEELGLTRVGIAEQHGGSGGTLDDLIVIVRALAQNGTVTPLVESATADWILAHAGQAPSDPCTIVCQSNPVLTGQLPGSVLEVPWGRWASQALVLGPDGVATLAELEAADATVTPGNDMAGAQLDQVTMPTARPTGVHPAPTAEQIRTRMGLLRSATLAGAVRGAYQLTRSYVRDRHQFGKPLVKIPGVATALAAIRTQVILAEAALNLACERNDACEHGDLAAVATARVVCGAAATETAQRAHQLHGAMGITMEYPLHHLTRILWTTRDADLPEQRWAELLGEATLAGGERALWEDLTTPAPEPSA